MECYHLVEFRFKELFGSTLYLVKTPAESNQKSRYVASVQILHCLPISHEMHATGHKYELASG